MLRIGICDDVYDARLVLRSALERVLEKRRVQGQFWEFSSGEGLLRWLEGHAGELDIVFLDMEMGELDGMETARRLRAADSGLQLVFVTGYADHVFDGYSVGALGYLLKPPKAEQLEAVLDRAQAALVRDLDRAYICRSGDTHYRIPIANILYFVSDRRQVTCVTEGRDYTFYGKLDAVAEEVGAGFVRVHQRYLVRAGAVDRMEGGEVVLRDGQHLPVSRSCQQSALLALPRAELEGGGDVGCSLEVLALSRVFPDGGGQRLFPLPALHALRPAPERAVLEGAALFDPGGHQRHGDLERGPQSALYAAGVLGPVLPVHPGRPGGAAGSVHDPLLPGDVRVRPAGHLCGADQPGCAL